MPIEPEELPGSRACVGCQGLTFRNRGDGLCPRCAFDAESLIEQIELESLERDLTLMAQFDAYCHRRETAIEEGRDTSEVALPEVPVIGRRLPFEGVKPWSSATNDALPLRAADVRDAWNPLDESGRRPA